MTWQDRINMAKKKKWFSSEDRTLATSFRTCAVSERMRIKPRSNSHAYNILTNKAQRLGEMFLENVACNKIKDAQITYNQIKKLRRVRK